MIDLNFGKYGIKTSDKLNIILYENTTVTKEDSPHFGKPSINNLGYDSSLDGALKAYINLRLADNETNYATAEELLTAYAQLKREITEEVKCLKT